MMRTVLVYIALCIVSTAFGQTNSGLKKEYDGLKKEFDSLAVVWKRDNGQISTSRIRSKDLFNTYLKVANDCDAESVMLLKTAARLKEKGGSTSDSLSGFSRKLNVEREAIYAEWRRKKEELETYHSYTHVVPIDDLTSFSSAEQTKILNKKVLEYKAAIKQNKEFLLVEQQWLKPLDSLKNHLVGTTNWLHTVLAEMEALHHDLKVQLERLEADGNVAHPAVNESFSNETNTVGPKQLDEPVIYEYVEVPAEFPGGKEAMDAYILENLITPIITLDSTVGGNCFLRFVVSENGIISNVFVQRGVPDCKECDVEAIRLLRSMPNWTPARNLGKNVNSYCVLKVRFDIQ